MNKADYEKLLELGEPTVTQKEKLDAYFECGTSRKAANKLGCAKTSVNNAIAKIRKKAATKGYSLGMDVSDKILSGQVLRGTSTYTTLPNGDRCWIKSEKDKVKENPEIIKNAIIEEFKSFEGNSLVWAAPKHLEEDLLAVIAIGDAHLACLSWGEESGEDFDLKIAERDLTEAMTRLVASAPNAGTCLIAELGDYFHKFDDTNKTKSGNNLDSDSRYMKMMRVGVRIMIKAVDLALVKFGKVIVRNTIGNHCQTGEMMLSLALEMYYSNNDRVQIESSPNKFWAYQFGDVMFMTTHGDMVKHNQLPMVAACDYSEMWGKTKHRYIYIGHIHTQTVTEYQGCVVESFNCLAANDAWHHSSGYRSKKSIKLIVHHKKYGEVERITKDISMIHAYQNGSYNGK